MATVFEVGIDANDPEALAPFWAAALGYTVGETSEDGVYVVLEPPTPGATGVYLQRVPEPKAAKNRLHLDLLVDDPAGEVDRLVGLGATRLGEPQVGAGGSSWQVMADPAGNEFCVCSAT